MHPELGRGGYLRRRVEGMVETKGEGRSQGIQCRAQTGQRAKSKNSSASGEHKQDRERRTRSRSGGEEVFIGLSMNLVWERTKKGRMCVENFGVPLHK